MNLTELKQKAPSELVRISQELGLENLARLHKKDMIFTMLKALVKRGEEVSGDGVLEILPDGFGFLRSATESYLAGPDDIYISPSQIRRFNLHTGDTIHGKIRPPKEGERYFALILTCRRMPKIKCYLKILRRYLPMNILSWKEGMAVNLTLRLA